jgi:hypothetical protein
VSSLKESLVVGCSGVFVGLAAVWSPALWRRQLAAPLTSWGWWACGGASWAAVLAAPVRGAGGPVSEAKWFPDRTEQAGQIRCATG